MMRMRLSLICAAALLVSAGWVAADPPAASADRGERVYADHCARCHDQARRPAPPAGLTTRPFDFRRCDAASAEPLASWLLAIRKGGPSVGRSADMPAFESTLSADEIDAVARYLRGRCTSRGWPTGDLNFPRPLLTEKAFPEDEAVLQLAASRGADGGGQAGLVTEVEKRLGRRSMVEIAVPASASWRDGDRAAGIGDVSLAAKHVLHADSLGTRILSAGLEVTFPTATHPGAAGAVVFEPFVAAGFRRGATYLQASVQLEVASRGGDREIGYGVYAGREVPAAGAGWALGAEVTGEGASVAVTPQVRRRLTRTGALAAGLGLRVPLNDRAEQPYRWLGYLAWDFREPIRARR
jgi:mono/diheme cytochrome c family protein